MSGRVPPQMNSLPRRVPSVQQQLFRQRRLWMQFATYRPLAVLAGIWVGLLAIALLAYGQLMHAANNQPDPTAPAANAPYPHERMRGTDSRDRLTNPPEDGESDRTAAEAEIAAAVEPTTVNGLSGWTLLALVGGCATGCWLLSALLKMPRRPKRQRPKRRPQSPQKYRLATNHRRAAKPLPPQQPQPAAATVPKLDVYDPEQPLVSPSPSPARAPRASSPSLAAAPVAAPDVTVVSEQVQHRLDWPSDSLVNTADVRQRRSLSSFL